MFNEPLAYLITFTCYGTWLHGDKRGSVDKEHNTYQSDFVPPNDNRKNVRMEQLTCQPVVLDNKERKIVGNKIIDVCQHRQWKLHASCVNTNHVHIVVSGVFPPEKIMADIKAYTTRELRSLREKSSKIWTQGGSTRYLWNEKSLVVACEYVQKHNQQEHQPEPEA